MNDKFIESEEDILLTGHAKNNVVTITGCVSSEQEYSHEVFGEGFYKFNIETRRLSESSDFLPVTFSERLCDRLELSVGTPIEITGQIRSYNNYSESRNKLILTIFAKDIVVLKELCEKDKNQVIINGFVCRKPVFRTTPFGREISDILLAVNRAYNKSDYIPLIAWGRNARFGGSLAVGDKIGVCGRMQSRNYQKKSEDGEIIEKVALEVSISKIEKT